MNERKILRLFPNASRAFVEANARLHPSESSEQAGSLDDSAKGKAESLGRVIVRFTCYRVRLLDWDNNAASCKDLLDGLRHAHLIVDDSTKHIKVEAEQVTVKHFADQKTEIEIVYP